MSTPETGNTPSAEHAQTLSQPSKLIGNMMKSSGTIKLNQHSKLNLGCGHQKLPGWTNIDMEPSENPDMVLNLGVDTWPFPTDSVDETLAHHILEHLTTEEFFHFMKELYRVLKPNAVCSIAIPHPRHNVFLNDPTHRMPVTPDTIAMFCQANFRAMIETVGGRLTPFWRYNRIDFDMAGNLNCVLDERITEEQRTNGEWRDLEMRENNVVIEWRFLVKAVKPFLDMGEPVPFARKEKPVKKSPVHKIEDYKGDPA